LIFKRLFKGYVLLEMVCDIGFIVLLLFVVCMIVYKKQLYNNPFYLIIAAIICIGLLFALNSSIKGLIKIRSEKEI